MLQTRVREGLVSLALGLVALVGLLLTAAAQRTPGACAGTVADLNEMINCLKDVNRPHHSGCKAAPVSRWVEPIAGLRVLDFGEKSRYGTFSRGIAIESQRGSIARTPVGGLVLYASEFRTYGKLVVLDACTVDVLIAGLDTLTVAGGEIVEASAELGRMAPDTGKGLPVFYFEVRDAGRPVDPNKFMK